MPQPWDASHMIRVGVYRQCRYQGLDASAVKVVIHAGHIRKWRLPGDMGRQKAGPVDSGERNMFVPSLGADRGPVRVPQQLLDR